MNKDYFEPTEQDWVELSEAQGELQVFLIATQTMSEEQAYALACDYDSIEKCDQAINEICETFQLSFAFMRDDLDSEDDFWF